MLLKDLNLAERQISRKLSINLCFRITQKQSEARIAGIIPLSDGTANPRMLQCGRCSTRGVLVVKQEIPAFLGLLLLISGFILKVIILGPYIMYG